MSEWHNYGDVNCAEHGGILLRQRDNSCDYDFVEVRPVDDASERMYAVSGYLFIDDYTDEEKKKEICEVAGIAPDFFTENNLMDYACEVIEYYGGEQLDGRPIIHDSAAVEHNDIDRELRTQNFVLKQELYDYLNDIGFEIENPELKEAMAYTNEELADTIEDFMYANGDYDLSKDDDLNKWFSREGDRSETVDNLTAALNDKSGAGLKEIKNYFDYTVKNDISAADEQLNKAVMIQKVLNSKSDSLNLSKDKSDNERV